MHAANRQVIFGCRFLKDRHSRFLSSFMCFFILYLLLVLTVVVKQAANEIRTVFPRDVSIFWQQIATGEYQRVVSLIQFYLI